MVEQEDHPLLSLGALATELTAPLGELPSPEWLRALLTPGAAGAPAELAPDDTLRGAVRDLLRHGGYKPTGRGKPSSEYLLRAAGEGTLASINLAVDVCNAVSLHSGLPISVVDLDRTEPPLRVAIVRGDERYVFNAAGQEIALEGLLCLHDARGPCANGVKDSQRTKTNDATRRTLSILWGTRRDPERTTRAHAWYRELLERAGQRVRS
jgi:DNA/RNA-binding domain of Phe-tRNA-synthetase-like protein